MEKLPNILSTFRLLMAPVFFLLFIQEDVWIRAFSLFVFLVAALTDFFDGYVARRYNVESPSGVFLDPLADKFLTFSGFICLAFLDPSQFPLWAISLIVFRDLAITLLRIYTDRRGIMLATRKSAKIKTAFQMGFLYVSLILGLFVLIPGPLAVFTEQLFSANLFFWLMMGVTAITVYTGIEYIIVNRDLLRSSKG